MDKYYDTNSSYDLTQRRTQALVYSALKGYELSLFAFAGQSYIALEKDGEKLIINNYNNKNGYSNIKDIESKLVGEPINKYSDFEKKLVDAYRIFARFPKGDKYKDCIVENIKNELQFLQSTDYYSEDENFRAVLSSLHRIGEDILKETTPANEFLETVTDIYHAVKTTVPGPEYDVYNIEKMSGDVLNIVSDIHYDNSDLTVASHIMDYLEHGRLVDLAESGDVQGFDEAYAFADMYNSFGIYFEKEDDTDESNPDDDHEIDDNSKDSDDEPTM